MERLISMTDFVLEQVKRKVSVISHMICIEDYANFLKQKLELWMFVPCKLVDGVWVVFEEPIAEKLFHHTRKVDYDNDLKEYQEAKDRVLFANFKYYKMGFAYLTTKNECVFDEEYMYSKTIEDLVKYNLELTPAAEKQIGL